MKKISLLLVATLLLAACKQAPGSVPTNTEPQTQGEAMNEFSKVAAAMQAGRPVSCTMTKTDGSSTMDYLIKGKKMKISGIEYQGKQNGGAMISDGEYMYTWDESTKAGMKFAIPKEEDVEKMAQNNTPAVPSLSSEEDKKRYEDEGYRVDCKELAVDDTVFIPPSDVKFSDLSSMMENSKKLMVKPDEAPSADQQKAMEDQVNQMMQQYGQQ